MRGILNTDGGSRGNPGPAALGAVLQNDKREVIAEKGVYLGITTNNVAEYKGLVVGLEMALDRDIKELDCFLDSELIVKQLNGQYKVKNPGMIELYSQVKELEKKFTKITYSHVFRANNKGADALVNEVLDEVENA